MKHLKIFCLVALLLSSVMTLSAHANQGTDIRAFHTVIAPDNSVWLATSKGAIHISGDDNIEIYDRSSGLACDTVTQVLIASDGTKWFAHGGVYATKIEIGGNRLESIGGTLTQIAGTQIAGGVSHLRQDGNIQIFNSEKGLPTSMVNFVAADLDATMWFATNTGVVYLKNDGQFETLQDLLGFSRDIRHILVDKYGRKWFSIWEYGAVCIDQSGNIAEKYDKSIGLASNVVTQTLIDADGTKWFAHGGVDLIGRAWTVSYAGVSHLKADESIEIFNVENGLPSGIVYCIAADLDGTKWFGTDKGVAHLKHNGQFEVFDNCEGLPDSIVRHILVDGNGRKWFATDKGVARMEKDGKVISVYP